MKTNINKDNLYYDEEGFTLLDGDSVELLEKLEEESFDMIFADPPYFLSGSGITCSSGKMVSVKKAKWDEERNVEDKLSFNKNWISKCKRILKPNGSLFISGTFHNIYTVGVALELEGFQIINNITWRKTNPPPNIACRTFTHSTETILWAKKKGAKHKFNYKLMKEINNNKQMKDVWESSLTKPSEKKLGKHPTQKPLSILERIILASTDEEDLVLDPFNGSGTTGIASVRLNRKYLGIDNVKEYLELTKLRYEDHMKGKGSK